MVVPLSNALKAVRLPDSMHNASRMQYGDSCILMPPAKAAGYLKIALSIHPAGGLPAKIVSSCKYVTTCT